MTGQVAYTQRFLATDAAEEHDLSEEHPDVVNRLTKEADRVRRELGAVGIAGTDQRKIRLKNPQEREAVRKMVPDRVQLPQICQFAGQRDHTGLILSTNAT